MFSELNTVANRLEGNGFEFKKLAVQWLQEVQFSNQTFVGADSFVLRNRQLLVATNVSCNFFRDHENL